MVAEFEDRKKVDAALQVAQKEIRDLTISESNHAESVAVLEDQLDRKAWESEVKIQELEASLETYRSSIKGLCEKYLFRVPGEKNALRELTGSLHATFNNFQSLMDNVVSNLGNLADIATGQPTVEELTIGLARIPGIRDDLAKALSQGRTDAQTIKDLQVEVTNLREKVECFRDEAEKVKRQRLN